MRLDVLPARSGSAAENMATDLLLLQRYPEAPAARFRHYGWRRPAFTFGYSQKIAQVRAQLPAGEPVDLCRRPTGGGLVDHRDDWTYALVIPAGHALCDARAPESYRVVHAALAEALRALGRPAALQDACAPCPPGRAAAPADVCFARAEVHDVVDPRTGAKIAGAALKRTRHGLLFQGSVSRAAAGPLDWDALHNALAERLARALGAAPEPCGWPEFSDDELAGLIEQYASAEWNEGR